MKNRTIRYFLLVALLLAGGCLTGCKSATREQIDNGIVVLDKIGKVAEENACDWDAEFEYDGTEHSVFWGTQVGIKIPVKVRARIHGNSAAGRMPKEFTEDAVETETPNP